MTITVTCSQCAKTFKAPDTAAGRKARCPSCGHAFEIPKPGAEIPAAQATTAGPPGKPVVPEPVIPEPVRVESAPLQVAARPVEAAAAPPEGAEAEQEAFISVPPVGVQTPTGLSAGARALARRALRWHRKLAAGARIAGFVLGGLCLVLGITGMMVLALRGRALLLPALGTFLGMLVLAITLALGGLIARHVLLILADLGEVVHRQQQLLDEINDRLD